MTNKKYAYVWLLMKGDRYAPGLITSAYSIKKTKPKNNIDFVAMITNDVSKKVIRELKKIMNKIVNIEYIENISNIKILTKRQKELYSKWNSVSYTKWNILCLSQYKKVLLIDADIIITKNIDNLFNIEPPAACFHNYWSEHFMKNSRIKEYYLKKNQKELKHNSIVNDKAICNGLTKRGYVINGGLVLLKPDKKYFKSFKKMLNFMPKFGFDSSSLVDEQSIVYFMRFYKNGPKKKWRNISRRYNAIAMKELKQNFDKKIKAIHYMGEELPWETGDWDDLIPYLCIAKESIIKLNLNLDILNFKKLDRFKKINKKNKFLNLFEYKI